MHREGSAKRDGDSGRRAELAPSANRLGGLISLVSGLILVIGLVLLIIERGPPGI